jgi:hypothetical protein
LCGLGLRGWHLSNRLRRFWRKLGFLNLRRLGSRLDIVKGRLQRSRCGFGSSLLRLFLAALQTFTHPLAHYLACNIPRGCAAMFGVVLGFVPAVSGARH